MRNHRLWARKRRMVSSGCEYDQSMTVIDVFTEHPKTVGESWAQHARFALSASGLLARAALAAAIHAVVPALFETTASRTVDELHARIHGPHCTPGSMDPAAPGLR